MATQAPNIPILKPEPTVLPPAVLENLAARFRPGGLFLVVLRQDGSVAYRDPGAGVFFERYVFPLLKASDPTGQLLRDRIESLAVPAAAAGAGAAAAGSTAPPAVAAWELPGVWVAAFPHVEKRQAQGVILLAAKGAPFSLGEDVLRACGQLGLDGLWLLKQSEELPAYGEEAIRRQGRLLAPDGNRDAGAFEAAAYRLASHPPQPAGELGRLAPARRNERQRRDLDHDEIDATTAQVKERGSRALVEQRCQRQHERVRRQRPPRDRAEVLPRVAQDDLRV